MNQEHGAVQLSPWVSTNIPAFSGLNKGADWVLLHLEFTTCKDLYAELNLHTELSVFNICLRPWPPELSTVSATLKWIESTYRMRGGGPC